MDHFQKFALSLNKTTFQVKLLLSGIILYIFITLMIIKFSSDDILYQTNDHIIIKLSKKKSYLSFSLTL